MNEIDCHKCFITDDLRKHTIMHLGKTLNIYAVCRKKVSNSITVCSFKLMHGALNKYNTTCIERSV